ncbi:MAG: serine/threonine-protein kinase [Ktedonobacteraceae bacterium]
MASHVGRQFGNYRLTQLLGTGGFADVYLGEQVYLKSLVAIKVLSAPLAPEATDGFLREAQILVNLVHPHIVRLLDYGVEEQTPYLVMDYAPGGTLRERMAPGQRFSLPTVVAYVKQVAEALQYAHDLRLIHRDVKPANLLLGRYDEVLLSDFGISLLASSSRSLTTRDIAGTITYMAPEQIQGHPRQASDQYALGVIVYEWLAGKRPFSGSFTEIAAQHCLVAPPSLREANPHVHRVIETVILHALAKRPEQRFANVQAFAETLERAVAMTARRPAQLAPVRAGSASGMQWRLEDDFEGIAPW